MKIPAHVLLFILCAVLFAAPLYAQQRKGGGEGGGPPGGGRHGPGREMIPFTDYDDRPFDITVEKLPRCYSGHNPKLLYNNIGEKGGSNIKSKAVTAEQYPGRIMQGDARPLRGTPGLNSTYAFLFKPTESFYNVPEQTLHVYCVISIISENKRDDETKRGFRVKYEPQKDNRYTYTDASGKKIEGEETKFRDYNVVFDNFREFPVERSILPSVKRTVEKEAKKGSAVGNVDEGLKRDIIIGNFKLPKEAAEGLTEMMRVLIVCNLVEPYITSDTVDIRGTPENPRTYFARHEYLHVHLLEIWFYDYETGRVFIKIRPNKSPA